MKKVFNGFLYLLLLFVIYLTTLFCIQDQLIFHPDTHYKNSEVFSEQFIKVSDNQEIMLWLKTGRPKKPLLLFLHGNTGQNHMFVKYMLPFIKEGYPVALMEYRGFGSTKGHIQQDRFYQDAQEIYDWLQHQGYAQIIPYGYSFGTTVATCLASTRDVYGVILTAPFSSLKALVKEKPVPFASWILKAPYASDVCAKKVKAPVLIIHGIEDPLIPFHHAQDLYKAFSSTQKELILLENETHRSVFFDSKNIPLILKWLNQLK